MNERINENIYIGINERFVFKLFTIHVDVELLIHRTKRKMKISKNYPERHFDKLLMLFSKLKR